MGGSLASSQQIGELVDLESGVADQASQRAASQFPVHFVAKQAHRPDEVIAGYNRQPHHLDDDFQNLGIFVGNRFAMLYQAFEVQP